MLYHAAFIVPGIRVGISFLWRFCAMGMCFNISWQVIIFGFACKSTLSYFIVPLVLVILQGTNMSHLWINIFVPKTTQTPKTSCSPAASACWSLRSGTSTLMYLLYFMVKKVEITNRSDLWTPKPMEKNPGFYAPKYMGCIYSNP